MTRIDLNNIQINQKTDFAIPTEAPPAFHLDRVFCFRSVGPGTPVMVRGYLQLQAEQGDHEASYRQPAERWVLSPVSTAPGEIGWMTPA